MTESTHRTEQKKLKPEDAALLIQAIEDVEREEAEALDRRKQADQAKPDAPPQ